MSLMRKDEENQILREAMQSAKSAAMPQARLEPAELVWWRAQLRKRQAALEKVSAPVRGAQAFTAALVLCVAAVVAVSGGGGLLKPLVSTAGLVGLGMVVVLAGVVVYLTLERE